MGNLKTIIVRSTKKKLSNMTVRLSQGEALRLCSNTSDINVIIELSRHESPLVRVKALKEICPCRVKEDIPEFWARVVEMLDDDDVAVRRQVCHTLCDGSPTHLEDEVERALQRFNRDTDPQLRRTAHKVLGAYRKTGKWNIL